MSDFKSMMDDILGRGGNKEEAEARAAVEALAAEAADPEVYRPLVTRPHPQLGFAVIEADGTMHGFLYHTLRHPKHQVRNGEEFLSFTADGIAVVMQGIGLRVIFLALLRHTLVEAREFDNRPLTEAGTKITRLEVQDTQERVGEVPRLVK